MSIGVAAKAALRAALLILAAVQPGRAEDGLPRGYTCATVRDFRARVPVGISEQEIDAYVVRVLGFSKQELAAVRRCLDEPVSRETKDR